MPATQENTTDLADRLWNCVPAGHDLYAVLDAARNPQIVPQLCTLIPQFVSLYRETAARTLWQVAPYLVQLERGSPFSQWLLEEGWGDSWGVLAVSGVGITTLYSHFRRFLLVKAPDERLLYFRYYDPRVLRTYLPSCNEEEAATVFGPVAAYLMESDDLTELLRFTLGPDGIVSEKFGDGEPAESGGAGAIASAPPAVAASDSDARIAQVILEVVEGADVGHKTWLRPGQQILVGRSEGVDFSAPHDSSMADAHFAVECSATACYLNDQSAETGTFVNGERVTSARLRPGDKIDAGQTRFAVRISYEGADRRTPPMQVKPLRPVAAPMPMEPPPAVISPPPPIAVPAASLPRPVDSPTPVSPSNTSSTRDNLPQEPMTGTVQSVVLEFKNDADETAKIWLRPGQILVVGRTDDADYAVGDPQMSARHFQLQCDYESCRLQDLQSRAGTFVNGAAVQQSLLRNGDRLLAGRTTFDVRISMNRSKPN